MTTAAFVALLSAICFVESGHNPAAINLHDRGEPSMGECEVKLSTARWLGFKGKVTDLWLKRYINRYYAGRYLNYQLRRYHDNVPAAVAAYNAGSAKRRNGKFINQMYVDRVLKALEERR